jgi:UDP-glucose 4-epimerase
VERQQQRDKLLSTTVRKVCVTGGAGFIGSHVVDALVQQGYEVTVLDDLSSGRYENLAGVEGQPNFRFLKTDLLELEAVVAAMSGHDLVWHLAANTDIPGGFTRRDADLRNCVIATFNVLDAMRQTGVRDLLFSSTGAVYGDLCRDVATAEDAGPLLPVSLYAAGKISSEAFISAYCALFGLRAWMFRFGNVIGARMTHGVIFDFIEKLRREPHELTILGDGTQEKNYFLVEECIDGMAHTFRNVSPSEDTPCDVYNLGTDSISRVTTIARIVIEEMGLAGVKVSFGGGTRSWPGDQPKVHIRVDRMKALGWQARRTSDQAVRIATRRMLGKSDEE